MLPLAALNQIKNLREVAVFSLLANVALVFGIAVVLAEVAPLIGERNDLRLEHHEDAPIFFGMATYTFEGIGLALPLRNAMKEPESFQFVWCTTLACLTAFFVLFGSMGYAAYGEETPGVITTMLEPGVMTTLVKIALCMALLFTYVLMMAPVFEVLESNWLLRALHWGPMETLEYRRSGLRATMVVLTILIALLVPNFGLFISLIGAVGCSTLAYILPSAFHIMIMGPTLTKNTMIKDICLLAFGVCAAIICTTTTVMRIVQGDGQGH